MPGSQRDDPETADRGEGLGLGAFITARKEEILSAWEQEIRHLPVASGMDRPALYNHLPVLLERVAEVADGLGAGKPAHIPASDAESHALQRLEEGFDLRQVITEFATLREVLLRLWSGQLQDPLQARQICALNAAVDRAVGASVEHFVGVRDRTMDALDRVAQTAAHARDLDQLLQGFLQALAELIPAVDTAALLLREDNRLRVRAAVGLAEEVETGFTLEIGQGFSGRVAAEGRPVLLKNPGRDDSVVSPYLRARGLKIILGIPLVDGGHVLGVAHMGSRTTDNFSDQDRRLFSAMVNRATAAIYQYTLREDAEQRAREQATLAELSHLALVTPDAQVVVRQTIETLRRTLAPRVAAVALVEVRGHRRPRVRHLWAADEQQRDVLVHWCEWLARVTVARRNPLVVDRLEQDPRFQAAVVQLPSGSADVCSGAGMCVSGQEAQQPYGALVVLTGRRHHFSRAEVNFLQGVANTLAGALERQRRSEFEQQLIGIVSHDLRNPLHAIALLCRSLLRRENLDAAVTRAALRIQASAERATRLIMDLLDFTQARMGAGIPLQRTPQRLSAFTYQVIEEIRLAHPERDILVEASGDASGQWDADRVAQILVNLVGNAVTYSPVDSQVTVRFGLDRSEVYWQVHNPGPPIAPEVMERLFEPLQRGFGHSAPGERNVGLGLYIVDQLVRAHGGTIDVSSSLEDGTSFTVRLPLVPPGADREDAGGELHGGRAQGEPKP